MTLYNQQAMKQLILSFILCLLIGGPILAQDNEPSGPLRARLEAMKVAFITEKTGIDAEQAKVFWPVYNEFEQKQQAIKQKYRPGKKIMQMSDQELEQRILDSFTQEEEILALKKELFQNLKEVINIRQIALLKAAEQEFNREVLRRMMETQKKRREQRLNNGNND